MNRFSILQERGVTVFRICGANFDASVTGAFLKAINEIERERTSVVVDLSAVDFIDSSGLGALCAMARHMKPRPARLVGTSGRLMLRLADVFGDKSQQCHETLADAISASQTTEMVVSASCPQPLACDEPEIFA